MSMHYGGRLENCLGKVYSRRHEISVRFYYLLFDNMPELREMFEHDAHKQEEMFSMMVVSIARFAATGKDPSEMAIFLREQHRQFDIPKSLYMQAGVLLRRAYLDVLGEQIGDFEKTLLTDTITQLINVAAEGARE